jgi:hypothetical protein
VMPRKLISLPHSSTGRPYHQLEPRRFSLNTLQIWGGDPRV